MISPLKYDILLFEFCCTYFFCKCSTTVQKEMKFQSYVFVQVNYLCWHLLYSVVNIPEFPSLCSLLTISFPVLPCRYRKGKVEHLILESSTLGSFLAGFLHAAVLKFQPSAPSLVFQSKTTSKSGVAHCADLWACFGVRVNGECVTFLFFSRLKSNMNSSLKTQLIYLA